MSNRFHSLLRTALPVLAVLVLAAVPATAAETVASAPDTGTPAVLAGPCGESLPLLDDLDAWLATWPATWPATGAPDGTPVAAPPFKLRTCRCSCGFPCQTDADCGGGACTAGITCCVMSTAEPAPVEGS